MKKMGTKGYISDFSHGWGSVSCLGLYNFSI